MARQLWCGGLILVAFVAVAGADDKNDAKAAQASFERFKKLAGEWVGADG
jgi:hypothetical protein